MMLLSYLKELDKSLDKICVEGDLGSLAYEI